MISAPHQPRFSGRFGRHAARRRGTILIFVMWTALGLIAVALYFAHTSQMEYRGADNGLAGLQAEQAIDGTRRYVQYILKDIVTKGTLPSLEESDYTAEALPIGEARTWLIGRDPMTELEQERPVFRLVDEASKLNLNTATQEMLELLPNMTYELAGAIMDWRDADEELSDGGAESPDYTALDTPYSAKNASFESVEELRLVRDMNLEVLYGEDANRNGVLDPNEDDGAASYPPDNGDGRLDAGLAEYVTVFTREPNKQSDGTARVNIAAQGSNQRLTDLLTTQLSADRATAIMGRVQAQLGAFRSPLEFYKASGMSADEFAKVEGGLTVTDGDYRLGLINPATASAAVLACLPGMTESSALELVSARSGKDETSLESTAWVGDVLDDTVLTEVGPYLTAQAWQFSADIVAVGANGRGFRRMQVVIDTEQDATVIYQRDMSRFGWPLGQAIRAEIKDGEAGMNRRL